MMIEEGKSYKTRDGRKAGPVRAANNQDNGPWQADLSDGSNWCYDNAGNLTNFKMGSPEDLIAEWTDGPVRTITRREIVRGQYADVDVGEQLEVPDCDNPDVPPVRKVAVAYAGFRSASELRAAAAVLLELAGALDA